MDLWWKFFFTIFEEFIYFKILPSPLWIFNVRPLLKDFLRPYKILIFFFSHLISFISFIIQDAKSPKSVMEYCQYKRPGSMPGMNVGNKEEISITLEIQQMQELLNLIIPPSIGLALVDWHGLQVSCTTKQLKSSKIRRAREVNDSNNMFFIRFGY